MIERFLIAWRGLSLPFRHVSKKAARENEFSHAPTLSRERLLAGLGGQACVSFSVPVHGLEPKEAWSGAIVGVGVERFSLGFGPKIFGKQVGDTEYMICAVPLGGYVKMVGEAVGEDAPPADIAKSFAHKPLPGRFLIVSAGALFNMISAVIIFTVLFASFGIHVPLDVPRIGGVIPNLPAAKAGLEKGDEVLSVAGAPVKTWKEMADKIEQSKGEAVPFVVKKAKDGSTVELTVQPESRDDPVNGGKKFAIGIARIHNWRVSPWGARSASRFKKRGCGRS